MKAYKITTKLTTGICLLLTISMAHAENWIDAGNGTIVDMDSIRKDANGLVYFKQRYLMDDESAPDPWIKLTMAYDCRKGIEYFAQSEDWISHGIKINLDSKETKFVCSRGSD